VIGSDDRLASEQPDQPQDRVDGFAPIRDYAAIGDGRTVALVARDGSIDWLTTPEVDSPTVFGALLDPDRGGSFRLAPDGPFSVTRRYLPGTGVLETTFVTAGGTVRVTDSLTVPGRQLAPLREIVRTIEGLAGTVPMRWVVRPRFGYGAARGRIDRRGAVPVASAGVDALAVRSFEAGEADLTGDSIAGHFEIGPGQSALLAISIAHQEPLIFASRPEIEGRLAATIETWRRWSGALRTTARWRGAVQASAVALKVLIYAPSGAVVAAPTTSLPEVIGGERNWDYRYCWIRDSAFTLDALLQLGCSTEADAFFWWLMQASQLTHPRLQVLYGIDGDPEAKERVLDLRGYRGSAPVRIGNGAVGQVQHDIYGDLLETAWEYVRAGRRLDPEIGGRLAGAADHVTSIWQQPDAGIWEVRSDPRHYTHSKMMCWVALDRAVRLAEAGAIPDRSAAAWRSTRSQIEDFIWSRCWSDDKHSLVRSPGSEDLDAALLLGAHFGFDADGDRLSRTIDAIGRELKHGPFVYRYSGEDGLEGHEGAFLACSFWLVEALARRGSIEEAAELMDELVGSSNDVACTPKRSILGPARSWGTSRKACPTSRCSKLRSPSKRRRLERVGYRRRRTGRDLRPDDDPANRERAPADADRPPVPARHGRHLRPWTREGDRLRSALRGRAAVLPRVRDRVRRARSERLAARRGVRADPRHVRRQRAGEHLASDRPPSHGNADIQHRVDRAARATRLHDAELRPEHPAREPDRAHRVRSDRGLVRMRGTVGPLGAGPSITVRSLTFLTARRHIAVIPLETCSLPFGRQ
jgi:GH15 family glucan-1,4-alpha-glucosidase